MRLFSICFLALCVNMFPQLKQYFVLNEKLWKTDCSCELSNLVMQRLPDGKGALNVVLFSNNKAAEGIIYGNICDMVKGYNKSTVSLASGKFKIRPCSSSDEEDIKISSQGLSFVYRAGVGLEYVAGEGVILMAGKSYTLPVPNNDWEHASKTNTVKSYQAYMEEYPDGEHIKDAAAKIDELNFLKLCEENQYFSYEKYLAENSSSKLAPEIKKKMKEFTVKSFAKEERINYVSLVKKYGWDNDKTTLTISDDGKTKRSLFGNLEIKGDFSYDEAGIQVKKSTVFYFRNK